jgi:threonine/homoserine/homoserine lactone efflux protein
MTIIKIGCAAYCIWMLVDHLTHSEEKKPEAEEQPA